MIETGRRIGVLEGEDKLENNFACMRPILR